MKKVFLIARPIVISILVIAMTSLFSGALFAQDTLAKKPQKVIKIKVDTDKDGKSVTIDTTIIIDENFDMEKFHQAMKEYEAQMKDYEKCMHEMEIELNGEEMEEAMKEVELSLRDVYSDMPQVKTFVRCPRESRYFEQLGKRGDMHFYGRPADCHKTVRISPPKRGESLSDVLGDIPMSSVINYKIKETKNGKRITIEVSDDVLFDSDEDIIIWQGDVAPPPPPPPPPPKLKKEVLIEKEGENEEKTE